MVIFNALGIAFGRDIQVAYRYAIISGLGR